MAASSGRPLGTPYGAWGWLLARFELSAKGRQIGPLSQKIQKSYVFRRLFADLQVYDSAGMIVCPLICNGLLVPKVRTMNYEFPTNNELSISSLRIVQNPILSVK